MLTEIIVADISIDELFVAIQPNEQSRKEAKEWIRKENRMTPNQYQLAAKRTFPNTAIQKDRIIEKLRLMPELSQILVAGMKLSSESGELNDALVKHICYNQPLDIENIIEECGDLLWYIALILDHCNIDMEVCMAENIEKLKIRYPEKFTEKDAVERKDKC